MGVCPFCGRTAYQKRNGIVAGRQRFKCVYCARNYTLDVKPRPKPPVIPRVLNKCLRCGRETPNPKYCSRSCAGLAHKSYLRVSTKEERYCKYCGTPVNNPVRICRNCRTIQDKFDWSKRTIGEVRAAAKYQVNGVIRRAARQIYKRTGLPQICMYCGYDKHVEICHIRAINSFPEETPVSVVSGIDNLVALCPNCHWEFDNGLLRWGDNSLKATHLADR